MSRANWQSVALALAVCGLGSTARIWAADPPATATKAVTAAAQPQPQGLFANPPGGNDSEVTRSPVSNSAAEQEIKRKLLTNTTLLEFPDGTPLKDAIDFVADKHRIPVMFDSAALKDSGLNPSTTTLPPFALKDISLRAALNHMLSPYGLTHLIKDDLLLITTKDKAATMLETRLFDVRDLAMRETDLNGTPEFDSLVEMIRQTVNPQSWDKMGGQCSVAPFGNNGVCALVVVQTYDGQEQIESLLAELRHLRPQRIMRQ
jgi:hypothetical protein